MRTVTESIIIKEEPWFVWSVLLKSHEYENWNPIYNFVEGDIALGEKVTIEVYLDIDNIEQYADEDSDMLFLDMPLPPPNKNDYRVIQFVENEVLEWEMKKFGGMLLTASHLFELSHADNGSTLLEVTMTVGGFLGNLMPSKMFYSYNAALCKAFNMGIKWYVEEGDKPHS